MSSPQKQKVTLSFKSKNELYEAYMPFIHNGGLFIKASGEFKLGQKMSLQLKLLDEPDLFPFTGRVVWITPQGAQGARFVGIGLQFCDEHVLLRDKIETCLAEHLNAHSLTHTL
ncbi:PilZ domain-containing protein [Oceanospirillum beijerinckii]|uniref:PilZ domain-containing protein n=1 Tax=Oceanospirillum beijerinckii TaxID=64976 RepID=UPI0004248C28|nr:PilZ domain-containing protein [Oceanospirillum beijerinckii]